VAKKSRTPQPPRRVQAPQRRVDPRKPRDNRRWIAAIAGALVLLAGAGGIGWAMTRDEGGAATQGPCRRAVFKAQEASHVPPAKMPENFKYDSYPPTSGPHHPSPAVWDVYGEPIPQRHLIHNLEHGGIVIQYGSDVSQETVDELVSWYRADPNGIIIAPLPDTEQAAKLADRITVGAWWAELADETNPLSSVEREEGRLLMCTDFDEETFSGFRDENRAHGPERFDLSQLSAGEQ
jgi:hypothetical protein